MRRKWCNRCQGEGHLKRDCPRGRLRVVPAPEPDCPVCAEVGGPHGVPDPWDLSHQPRIQGADLSDAYAYWDTSAPLVSIYEAWDGPGAETPETPAKIAREMRLRTEAARQVEESRAARGVL